MENMEDTEENSEPNPLRSSVSSVQARGHAPGSWRQQYEMKHRHLGSMASVVKRSAAFKRLNAVFSIPKA